MSTVRKHLFLLLFWFGSQVCCYRKMLVSSLLQDLWRPTARRSNFCLSGVPHQNRPPPPVSSSLLTSWPTKPRDPGRASSPWQDQVTRLPGRTAAVDRSGASQIKVKRDFAPLPPLTCTLSVAGRPCWTVSLITRNTPIRPCWKERLCRHK